MLNINSSDTQVCLEVPKYCTSTLFISYNQGSNTNTHYLRGYFSVKFANEWKNLVPFKLFPSQNKQQKNCILKNYCMLTNIFLFSMLAIMKLLNVTNTTLRKFDANKNTVVIIIHYSIQKLADQRKLAYVI